MGGGGGDKLPKQILRLMNTKYLISFVWYWFGRATVAVLVKGATSQYFELFFGSLKIVLNWKLTFK